MLPNVAEDAGPIHNFERQANSFADAYGPRVLSRSDFFESPAGRKFVATQEIGKRPINRSLILVAESIVGFSEARQAPEPRDTKDHCSAASQIGDKALYVVERFALGLFKICVMFDYGPPQVHHRVVQFLKRNDCLFVSFGHVLGVLRRH